MIENKKRLRRQRVKKVEGRENKKKEKEKGYEVVRDKEKGRRRRIIKIVKGLLLKNYCQKIIVEGLLLSRIIGNIVNNVTIIVTHIYSIR